MAFKNRKLFFDPNVINITAFCEPYCDPIGYNDNNRICPPLICKKSCPHSCINPFPSLIPPLHTPPPPPTTAANHQKKFLQSAHLYIVISLSILAALCFVFSTYSIYMYYKNRNRAPSSPPPQDDETRDDFIDEEHGPVLDHPIWYIRTIGLQQSAINAITICKYKRGDGLVEGTECSVCLNEFQEDETLRLLPKCNHAFHLPCIDTWLRSHTNCPMCRAGIVADTAALPARQALPESEAENSETQAAVTENSDEEETEERAFEDEEEDESTTTSEEDLVQPVRRSVSLDCVSASMISTAIANANSGDPSDTQLAKSKDLKMGNGSSHREPILMMKRSVSCSGNVLMKTSSNRNLN